VSTLTAMPSPTEPSDIPVVHVAGTGSYAAEIVDYSTAAGFRVAGLIELLDPARVGRRIHDLPVIAAGSPPDRPLAIVGAGGDRRKLAAALAADGWRLVALVHPTAHLGAGVTVAAGAIVGPGVIVGARTVIGEHALIGRGALIGHHVDVGAGAVVNPGVNVGGNTRIGAGVQLGMGAVVVAAGAVVIGGVGARTRVQGVPARAHAPELLARSQAQRGER
jgi:hypothetical protein